MKALSLTEPSRLGAGLLAGFLQQPSQSLGEAALPALSPLGIVGVEQDLVAFCRGAGLWPPPARSLLGHIHAPIIPHAYTSDTHGLDTIVYNMCMSNIDRAYIAGVLHGDGWCTRLTLGLRVNDQDFADAFTDAVGSVYGTTKRARRDERGYWLFRTGNKAGRFDGARTYEPQTLEEVAAWVRGLFDSEGHAQLRLNGVSENSYGRCVAMYSTDRSTLDRAATYLEQLGVSSRFAIKAHSKTHLGTKQVYELSVRGGRDNYALFARVVGSNLRRKQEILTALPLSYQPVGNGHCRRAQARGARTKRDRASEERLPKLCSALRVHLAQGGAPTYRACTHLDGYWSVRKTVGLRHSEIIALAKGDNA